MRTIVIQHSVYDPPGMIGDVLRTRGAQVQMVRTDLGNPLPAIDELDVLIVMGGPMSALDDEEHPNLALQSWWGWAGQGSASPQSY